MHELDSTKDSLNYQDEAMFFQDVLCRIDKEQMETPLHRFIGVLTFRSRTREELGRGTGTLISPNLVLTVAHNIYCR